MLKTATKPPNFSHCFLVAMPGLVDPTFAGSVVYVCEHSAKGAMGLVVNRPTDLKLQTLFERIDLKLEIAPLATAPVYFGGPVQTERGFVLHEAFAGSDYSSSVRVSEQICLTTSKDVLQAVVEGGGPKRLLITLGYAGWSAGKLETEIANNAWLTVPADPRILFDVPAPQRHTETIKLLGFDPLMLSSQAGHG